jgi:hypothetical protein
MRRLMMTTALLLAAISTGAQAQAPAAGDPHHPPQTATPAPAPAQPTPPAGQPGMGGMPMMNMMGGMPMMNMMGGMPMHMMMMRMMGMIWPGMATIDRVEGRIAFLRAELKITDAQASAWDAFAAALAHQRAKARRGACGNDAAAGCQPSSDDGRTPRPARALASRAARRHPSDQVRRHKPLRHIVGRSEEDRRRAAASRIKMSSSHEVGDPS